ncbi:MAG: hypothetical protein WKF57_21920, partial [Nakamurella sp.]
MVVTAVLEDAVEDDLSEPDVEDAVVLEGVVLGVVELGDGDGVVLGADTDDADDADEGTTTANTWKSASPTRSESAPSTRSEYRAAAKSAGTAHSTRTSPLSSAVSSGNLTWGLPANDAVTDSPGAKPSKTTTWVAPARTRGTRMLAASTVVATGAVVVGVVEVGVVEVGVVEVGV